MDSVYIFTLYPMTLLSSLFLRIFCRFPKIFYTIILSANGSGFLSSFPVCMSYILSPCPPAPVRTSITRVVRINTLYLQFLKKSIQSSTLSMMLMEILWFSPLTKYQRESSLNITFNVLEISE